MRRDQINKMNMILVQAYPANETLSAGIIRFLSDYFCVHFINLPGFHPSTPAMVDTNLNSFVKYVEAKIQELQLENYILAGISLGFLVVNNVNVNKKHCLAVLASGPYLGYEYLNSSKLSRSSRIFMLSIVLRFGLENRLWRSRVFRSLLSGFLGHKSKEIIEVILDEVDPRAFFGTGLELLKYNKPPQFQDIPYILLINPEDSAIKFSKTLNTFWQGVKTDFLRVILTDAAHYPEDPSYEYFKATFTKNEIESLFNFVQYVSNC